MAPFSDILGCDLSHSSQRQAVAQLVAYRTLLGEETFIRQKDKQDGTAVRELQDSEHV